jgi:hypothetical protein
MTTLRVAGAKTKRAAYGVDEAGGDDFKEKLKQLLPKILKAIEALMKALGIDPSDPSSGQGSGSAPAGGEGAGNSGAGGGGAPKVGGHGGGNGGGGGCSGAGGSQGGGDKPSAGGSEGAQGAGGKPGAEGAPNGAEGAGGSGGAQGSKALIDEINRVRKEHGLNPVTEAANLNRAAAENDAAQQTTGIGHHVDLVKNGASGEIAFMASNGAYPQNSVRGWLDSPGHRASLLDPNMTKVGADMSGQYSTADFS